MLQYKELEQSSPFPLGITEKRELHFNQRRWNFAIYSKNQLSHLVLQEIPRNLPPVLIPLDITKNRTGDIWHITLELSTTSFAWCWKSFDTDLLIQDPYATLLDTGIIWGDNRWDIKKHKSVPLAINFDWETISKKQNKIETDKPLIIYEMHIRGFTESPSSKTIKKGTFLGAIEKLDHLKKLGVTAIELLPITEFDESEWNRINPVTHEPLCNYWGYSPLSFFAPSGRYFSSPNPLDWPEELCRFIDACHTLNIKVILDMVFNHTGEGNKDGPEYSWKLLSKETYYLLDENGDYINYSGCGNTVNANHPVVTNMILDALRHWVTAYGIDGFRFDLASCLTRDQTGKPMTMPLLLEQIANDPVLSHTLLIMEPWDAAGLYHTGKLWTMTQKALPYCSEWNDRFRDDIRSFIKGTDGFSGKFATRFCGSQDLYGDSHLSSTSINFVTAHDGFSLYDLVSYNTKHNLENGEFNRDGMNDNLSWNCGKEGETDSSSILAMRRKQMENFLVALFLSKGTPMMLMGDEYGHTKKGNNNAWCQDNSLNWFDWQKAELEHELSSCISHLIQIREISNLYTTKAFLTPSDIAWHGIKLFTPDWSYSNRLVACSLMDSSGEELLYIAFYMGLSDIVIEIPTAPKSHNGSKKWKMLVNTGAPRPENFFGLDEAPVITSKTIKLHGHSSLVLYAAVEP